VNQSTTTRIELYICPEGPFKGGNLTIKSIDISFYGLSSTGNAANLLYSR
jgi:hypothetical protein